MSAAESSDPSARSPSEPGVVIGVDYGSVRIGLARTDRGQSMAFPLGVYRRRSPEADAQWFGQLVREHQPVRFVVGLPVHLDGRESQKSQEARRFGHWLAQITGVEVVFYDERFTTVEAQELLRQAGLGTKKARERLDMLAACALLQAYLEAPQRANRPPEALEDD